MRLMIYRGQTGTESQRNFFFIAVLIPWERFEDLGERVAFGKSRTISPRETILELNDLE